MPPNSSFVLESADLTVNIPTSAETWTGTSLSFVLAKIDWLGKIDEDKSMDASIDNVSELGILLMSRSWISRIILILGGYLRLVYEV